MEIRFVAQPFEGATDLRDFFHAVAQDDSLNTLRIIVAWAKRSGLGRAISDLQVIHGRGANIKAIVGVSEGGATEQGLLDLIDLSDESYVFHDAGRTFHPKVYMADGPDHALLLVGSHNLTAGGLAWNYETGIWCRLDLQIQADNQVRADVISYFERLRADTAVCVPLDAESLAAMLADKSLLIQDEGARSKPHATEKDAPEESDSFSTAQYESGTSVFGKSQQTKRPVPALASRRPAKAPRPKRAPITGAISGELPEISVIKRWFRQMDGTAAQQPRSPRSNATGNLRLNQAEFSIDHTKYFVQEFFAGLDWRPSADDSENIEVWVPMQTEIAGDYLGDIMLKISYNPKREAGQGNVTTVLHWGALAARMRANNYVNYYVNLERGLENNFRLIISSEPQGPFIY